MGIETPDGGKPSLLCFVDTSPLFSVTNAVEALILLIGSFYVFRIAWTPPAKLPLILLACALIGPQTVISKVSNNSKFVAFLRKVGIQV